MKNLLKDLGVMIVTGAAAIFGMVVGLVTFKADSIRFVNNDEEKKNEEAK